MNKVSVAIIARNEEEFIERCLTSVSWADEIIVVDGESTDRTPEIVQAQDKPWSGKTRFFTRKWDSFRLQRNYSLDCATHSWVLVIDCDEACTPELKKTLQTILADPNPSHSAYKVRRQEFLLGKPIRGGMWNPSYQDRFYKKEGVRYINDVHEYPGFAEEPGIIEEPLDHDPNLAPEKLLYKMNKYTGIEAWDRYQRGRRTNWFIISTAFVAFLFKSFFYYKAYRDGFHGLVISLLEGISRTVRHIKIWQIQEGTHPKHWEHEISK